MSDDEMLSYDRRGVEEKKEDDNVLSMPWAVGLLIFLILIIVIYGIMEVLKWIGAS